MKRITSIDFTRGIVMIIMALDHVRDLIHNNLTENPTDMATTTPVFFFTRWITHLCAPTFVFLAGVSVYINLKNTDIASTRKFLLTRGLWLLVVEFTLLDFGLFFDIGFHILVFEVIAAIGVGFIILALLIRLNTKTIGIIGLAILLLHNLYPAIPFAENSVLKTILQPLFLPGGFPLSSDRALGLGYPPIPWLGIMLAGFAAGKLFEQEAEARGKKFLQVGLGVLLFFVVVRFINIYGDPAPWAPQKNALFTFMSFINVTKYAPSLLFASVTLGVTFLILSIGERFKGKWMDVVSVYGKVPLFYFLLHFYLIHVILLVVLFAQGFTWEQMSFASGGFGRPQGVANGLSLGWIYVTWISVVVVLYKPCQWFGKYKSTHQSWWLRYL